jgi:hypothetical protein
MLQVSGPSQIRIRGIHSRLTDSTKALLLDPFTLMNMATNQSWGTLSPIPQTILDEASLSQIKRCAHR